MNRKKERQGREAETGRQGESKRGRQAQAQAQAGTGREKGRQAGQGERMTSEQRVPEGFEIFLVHILINDENSANLLDV